MHARLGIIVLAGIAAIAVACGGKPETVVWRVIAPDGLNVREAADPKARVVAQLVFNDEVIVERYGDVEQTLHGKTGKWAQVKHDGGTGWVFAPFLAKRDATPPFSLAARLTTARVVPLRHRDKSVFLRQTTALPLSDEQTRLAISETERRLLMQDSAYAQRSGDVLHVRMPSGKRVAYTNRHDENLGPIGYYYHGYERVSGAFIIVSIGNGMMGVTVLGAHGGRPINAIMQAGQGGGVRPAFSPDRRHVCLMSYEAKDRKQPRNRRYVRIWPVQSGMVGAPSEVAVDDDAETTVIPVWIENDALRLVREQSTSSYWPARTNAVMTNRLVTYENGAWVVRQLSP